MEFRNQKTSSSSSNKYNCNKNIKKMIYMGIRITSINKIRTSKILVCNISINNKKLISFKLKKRQNKKKMKKQFKQEEIMNLMVNSIPFFLILLIFFINLLVFEQQNGDPAVIVFFAGKNKKMCLKTVYSIDDVSVI